MKVRHTKKPLPRNWSGLPGADKAELIADIFITRHSRLRAKLLVFRSRRDFRKFWRDCLHKDFMHDLGGKCVGAVNGLAYEFFSFAKDGSEKHRMEVDKNFFCVIGLVDGYLTTEYITHESVHAAFCYAKRVNKKDMWAGARDLDEENVCYPAGIIAKAITDTLIDAGYKIR